MRPLTAAPVAPGTAAAPLPAIEVNDLTRVFRRGRRTLGQRLRRRPDMRERFAAVDRLDLRVEHGEILGLLGPNGAGKTTVVRMLATLLEPTGGTIRICGVDALARPRQARALLGAVLGGERSVYWKLTGRENLEYYAALYHLPRGVTAGRTAEVLAAVGLTERADDYVERYSTGMRQRLALARAVLADPPLLLLDEPTAGLDPQASADLRERIRGLCADGKAVLLTTHDMDEADRLCDRVAIMDRGRIVALGPPAALKRALRATQVVELEVDVAEPDEPGLVAAFGEIATVASNRRAADAFRVVLNGAATSDLVPLVVETARRNKGAVRRVDVVPVTLEDVFLSLTGRGLRE
jgi:ABC-2 type transport system ATP-binding protein